MTARLYLTVYAGPTEYADGESALGVVNEATELEYKTHLHGTGSGRVRINRHHTQAALLQKDRYCTVHSDAGIIGGLLLEEGSIDLSASEGFGDEWLTWTGRGQMAVLERAIMDMDSNLSGGQDPIDGFWDLSNQGDFAGASNGHPIPMMKRVLNEVQANTPNGIPFVDHSSWDYDLDTDGSTPPFWGEIVWGADIGDDALDLAGRMSQLGDVVWQMSHDFVFDAYLTFGTDKSGAFGAGTVRFEKGTNIADAVARKVRGNVNRTHLIVGGAERTYVTVADPDWGSGDPVYWGFLSVPETADTAALEEAGLANIAARKRQTDTFSFPQHDHGDDPTNGIYEPGDHYWVGDTVTLHTGTGAYDSNAEPVPVAAITWQLKTGDEANGDYWVIPEVGSTFNWTPGPSYTAPPGGQHIPCPNCLGFCEPGAGSGTETVYEHYDWDDGEEEIQHPVDGHDSIMLSQDQAVGLEPGADGTDHCGSFGSNSAIESSPVTAVAGTSYRIVSQSQGFGMSWPTTDFGRVNWSIALQFRNADGDLLTEHVIASHGNAQQDGPFLTDAGGTFTAPSGTAMMTFKQAAGVYGSENANTKWDSVTIYTVSGGGGGGLNPDLAGTDDCVAHQDHQHQQSSDRPPAVSDDEDAGYPNGTIWVQLDDPENPTSIVGVWVLIDNTTGEAVWLPIGAPTEHTHDSSASSLGAGVGVNLHKYGQILTKGTGSEANRIDSPSIFWDHERQRWGMTYTGYSESGGNPHQASIHLAYSDDLLTWEKYASNPILSGDGSGSDSNGCTGGYIYYEDGTYYLFYIGLTANGYEGGTKTLNVATATDPQGSWTRSGSNPIISPSGGTNWYDEAIWHPSILKVDSTYYLFFNATGTVSAVETERIGYATADSLGGPWTVNATHVLGPTGTGADWDGSLVGDPSLYRIGEYVFMAYYGKGTAGNGRDGLAWCHIDDFPGTWTRHASNPTLEIGSDGFDEQHAHKPFIVVTPAHIFHFYTAVDDGETFSFGLAISGGPRQETTTPVDVEEAGRWEPVTHGGEVVFHDGDIVMTWIPNDG